MKIISFRDGLGNQLFQYQLFLYLRKLNPKEKIYGYYNKKWLKAHNGLEIFNHFDVEMPKATFLSNLFVLVLRLIDKVIPIVSRDNHFNLGAILFMGYWQDKKYWGFKPFQIPFKRLALDEKNQEWVRMINSSNSVFVHIRRGDYLLPGNEIYNVCNLSYYEQAIVEISKFIDNPKFFIFSDDIAWVKDNLKIKDASYIDNNKGINSFIDMYLMSCCKGAIIANSSFSYWGAVNGNSEKIVIYPKKWKLKSTNKLPNIFKDEWIGL